MAIGSLRDIVQKDRLALSNLRANVTIDGMTFSIRFLSREALRVMAQRCVTHVWDPATSRRVPRVDYTKLAKELADALVDNWSGVTPRKLARFIPMNRPLSDAELDTEIPYTSEDLQVLLENVPNLDANLQDAACDASLFQPANLPEETKN